MTAMRDDDASFDDGVSDADEGWVSDEATDPVTRSESSGAASISGAEPTPSRASDEDAPTIEYRRLGTCVEKVLKDDVVSCAAAGDGVFALGTKSSLVHVFTHSGDFRSPPRRATSVLSDAKRSPHAAPITALAFDARAEHLASCAMDGTVCVVRLGTRGAQSQIVFSREYDSPALCVAADPSDGDRTRRLAVGARDGRVLVETFETSVSETFETRRNASASTKDSKIIHGGEGPVRAMAWRGSRLAWANDLGVKIYDVDDSRPVAFIDRPRGSPPPGRYAPHLAWDGETTLLIGWADCVKVVDLRARGKDPNPDSRRTLGSFRPKPSRDGVAAVSEGSDSPTRLRAEVTDQFQTEYVVAGIAPFGEDELVVLAFLETGVHADEVEAGVGEKKSSGVPQPPGREGGAVARRPEIRVLRRTRGSKSRVTVTRQALGVLGYESCRSEAYGLTRLTRLEPAKGSDGFRDAFLVTSPRDAIRGRRRSAADRIARLAERRAFDAALDACDAECHLGASTRARVVSLYLEDTLKHRAFAAVGSLCPRLFRNDGEAWERWIFEFLRRSPGESKLIASVVPYVPTTHPTLRPEAYEAILHCFLASREDHARFLATVKAWPFSLYGVAGILAATRSAARALERRRRRRARARRNGFRFRDEVDLEVDTLGTLREALAELYLGNGQPERALATHVRLGRPTVLDFVARHDLFRLFAGDETEGVSEDGATSSKKKSIATDSFGRAVASLFSLDPPKATRLFVDRRDVAPPEFVAARLRRAASFRDDKTVLGEDDPGGFSHSVSRAARETYHLYLRGLFAADSTACASHRDAQVGLFAEFHPEELGAFLRAAIDLNLDEALGVVARFEERADANSRRPETADASVWRVRRVFFARARAFLLSRLGATRSALRVLIELGDVESAVALTHARAAPDAAAGSDDEGDDELWDELIDLVTRRAGAGGPAAEAARRGVCELLDVSGKLVDPTRVLARVPSGVPLDGLRERLVRVLADRRASARRAVVSRDARVVSLSDARRRRFVSGTRAFEPKRIVSEDRAPRFV